MPPGKMIPKNALAMGVPVKIRENAVEDGAFEEGVKHYLGLCELYKNKLKRIN
ncbi:MAG: hypothetical protein NWP59_03855 [Candidatus Nanopelagicales bacterium]|nr:hypothetical protein [Candidatus Nanopelagicales bacterium]